MHFILVWLKTEKNVLEPNLDSEQGYTRLPIKQKKTRGHVESRSPAGKAVCLGMLPLMGKENRVENFRHKPKWTGKAREGLEGNEEPGQTPAYV